MSIYIYYQIFISTFFMALQTIVVYNMLQEHKYNAKPIHGVASSSAEISNKTVHQQITVFTISCVEVELKLHWFSLNASHIWLTRLFESYKCEQFQFRYAWQISLVLECWRSHFLIFHHHTLENFTKEVNIFMKSLIKLNLVEIIFPRLLADVLRLLSHHRLLSFKTSHNDFACHSVNVIKD